MIVSLLIDPGALPSGLVLNPSNREILGVVDTRDLSIEVTAAGA